MSVTPRFTSSDNPPPEDADLRHLPLFVSAVSLSLIACGTGDASDTAAGLLPDPTSLQAASGDVTVTEVTKLTASDAEASDNFGGSASGAGDVNGDGYADVIIAASREDDMGTSAGSAYVYLGSVSGIDRRTEVKLTASDGAAGDNYGAGVSDAGDLNADGYADVVVGAWLADGTDSNEGSAYVYLGSATGVDSGSEQKLTASDASQSAFFGAYVAGAGDVNGDGYDDLVVGATNDSSAATSAGAAYLYLGAASGIDASTEQRLDPSDAAEDYWFGDGVDGAGDVNGDGFADVIVGSDGDNGPVSWAGAAYVYHGSAAGLDASSETKLVASDATVDAGFGWVPASAGDVNADGYDDVIVGAYFGDGVESGAGAAYVYLGSASGIDSTTEAKLYASDGAVYDWFGETMDGPGDLDGDGYDDVIVSATGSDAYGEDAGAAYVYMGGSGGVDISTELQLAPSDAEAGDVFGYPVAGAGDVDGDGFFDLIIGAWSDDDIATDAGAAYLFHGGCGVLVYLDADGDGYGDPSESLYDCSGDPGYGADAADCDEGDASISPGAAESCNGVDDDCDGHVDESDAVDAPTWYVDADGDGAGVASTSTTACSQPSGYAGSDDDCDDGDATAYPGADELCDGASAQLSARVENEDAPDAHTWYVDADGDGYGGSSYSTTSCDQPSGWVDNADDCDDLEVGTHPDAEEIAGDGIDQDCDGQDPEAELDDTGIDAEPKGCASGGAVPRGLALLLFLPALTLRRRR